MGLDNDGIDVIKISLVNEHTLEDLMDSGLSFKEANEKMKTKWIEVENYPTTFEFVEGEMESGKKYYEEERKPLIKSYTATLTRIN